MKLYGTKVIYFLDQNLDRLYIANSDGSNKTTVIYPTSSSMYKPIWKSSS